MGIYNVTHSQSGGLKRHDVVVVNSQCCFWVVSAWASHPSPHIIHNNIPSLLQSIVTSLLSRAGCTEQMTPSLRLGGETLPHPQPLEIPNEALQPGGRTCFHGVFSVCTRVVSGRSLYGGRHVELQRIPAMWLLQNAGQLVLGQGNKELDGAADGVF